MGFFSGISKSLFGGSESESSSRSGFGLLPQEIQDVFKNYATDLNSQFSGGGANDLFTPLPQTEYETQALGSTLRGTTPDAAQLNSDIAMQMNPFDEHVIGGINREAQGDYSILKQGLNEAGQFGSNRQLLGANDIENTRLDMIGRFKQGQFDKAVDNSLNTLANSRGRDIGLQFGAGDFLRGLDTQTRQAPIDAMRSFGQLLGVLPTSGGSEGTSSSDSQSGAAGGIAGIASAFASDRRLKENIVYHDTQNGYERYKFNYKWDNTTLIGVIAQDIIKLKPEAVFMKGGFYGVDYSQLGFNMEVA